MAIKILLFCFIALTIICAYAMLVKLKKQPAVFISKVEKIKLFSCGIIAFVADTLGIGSFAVNTALAKMLNTFKDEELPAVNNGAQVIPGAISAFFFLKIVDVDIITLVILVVGTCIGGIIGGYLVSKFNKQCIRLIMASCFFLIATLLILQKTGILHATGEATGLFSWKLVVGFLGVIICGILASAGVGLFALIQGVLFLLQVSPIVAFPIMMTAGAMQQPLTTMIFLKEDKIPLKKTLIIALGGCVGVLLILPVFNYLTVSWLHSLLLAILIYNTYTLSKAYLKSSKTSLNTF